MKNTVILLLVLAEVSVAWRVQSGRTLLTCPAEFAWLVEIENPLASDVRSAQINE